jgi:hypothetical protein
MADMPTIYPMRFPGIPAERRPSSIDDLLPSTYMGGPSPFNASMQQVGKMLQAKSDDADSANNASLKFGPSVAPGQIAALNAFLFRHNPEGQQYGGVMGVAPGSGVEAIPGAGSVIPGAPVGGEDRYQTNAEQAAALKFKQDKDAAAQELAKAKMDQQANQFTSRSKQRDDQMLQQKVIADMRDHTAKQLKAASIAFQGQKLQTYNAAMGIHAQASTAFGNAKAATSKLSEKEKLYETTYDPTVKARLLEEMKPLHDLADSENARGQALGAQAQSIFDRLSGTQAGPVAPRAVQSPPTYKGIVMPKVKYDSLTPEAQKAFTNGGGSVGN